MYSALSHNCRCVSVRVLYKRKGELVKRRYKQHLSFFVPFHMRSSQLVGVMPHTVTHPDGFETQHVLLIGVGVLFCLYRYVLRTVLFSFPY